MARLERANAGVKVLCLTTWRHPKVEKTRRTGSYSRSPDQWGGIRGSNPRHPEPQSGALPTELIPPYTFQSFCFDAGAPGGTRTPGLLLRRQLLYPTELLAHKKVERVTGIEPASPAWKAGALAIVLHPHAPSAKSSALSYYHILLGSVKRKIEIFRPQKIPGKILEHLLQTRIFCDIIEKSTR